MTDWSSLSRSLRDLPPPDARTCLGVRRFMCTTLAVPRPWPLCVAGVSGGVDSSVLAVALHLLGMPLVLVHLDHGLREASAADAQHVAELAETLGVPFVLETVDVAAAAAAQGLGLEEAGRICRYALFERVRHTYGAAWILTGHHLDDLEEDVLMRLIRGGGWPALGGMAARDDARHLLRPLLHTPRAKLESLARAACLPWREDASNASRDFRRNRIRQDILPLIRAENPAFGQAVRRLWEQARVDDAYWQTVTSAALGAAPQSTLRESEEPADTASARPGASLLVPRAQLDSLPPAARLRVYVAAVRQLGMQAGQHGVHPLADAVLELDRLWQARQTGAVVHMPGIVARVTRDGVVVARNG